MNLKLLEEAFIKNYGKIIGGKLSDAIKKLPYADFCISIGWNHNEISISRGCEYRGRIFKFTKDYSHLIMPGGEIRSIENLSYSEIIDCLPKMRFGPDYSHCDCYRTNKLDPKWIIKLEEGCD